MALSLPRSQFSAFSEFVQLTADQRGRLVSALGKLAPTLDIDRLSESISRDIAIPSKKVRTLLDLLLQMYVVRLDRDLSPRETAQQICDFAASSPEPALKPADNDWEPIGDAIATVLGLADTLGVIAKGLNIVVESERLFDDGRIITEIRPIFADKLGDRPPAAVILHMLRIKYNDADGSNEFHVALNLADVQKLKATVDRALTKEQTLRQSMRDSLSFLDMSDE